MMPSLQTLDPVTDGTVGDLHLLCDLSDGGIPGILLEQEEDTAIDVVECDLAHR